MKNESDEVTKETKHEDGSLADIIVKQVATVLAVTAICGIVIGHWQIFWSIYLKIYRKSIFLCNKLHRFTLFQSPLLVMQKVHVWNWPLSNVQYTLMAF